MNHKGDEREDMSKQQLLTLLDKLGKNKHFLVNAETNTIIKNHEEITEDMSITIIPVIAGGSDEPSVLFLTLQSFTGVGVNQ